MNEFDFRSSIEKSADKSVFEADKSLFKADQSNKISVGCLIAVGALGLLGTLTGNYVAAKWKKTANDWKKRANDPSHAGRTLSHKRWG